MGYMKNYMLESNMEWYREHGEKLVAHINKLNAESIKKMEKDKSLWIGIITNNLDHWAEYDVHTVDDFENYLDNEATQNEMEMLGYC